MSAPVVGTGTARVQLFNEDCLVALKKLADNSIDALVTDPPAGIGFMGKQWDLDKGGSKQWVRWMESMMRECLRVLKPGAHGLVWALPRTSHWTGMACEWAGFEIRDCVYHIFGQGFPKSLDVSKAIDKTAGFKRDVVGMTSGARNGNGSNADYGSFASSKDGLRAVTGAPVAAASAAWAGWGSALKPAVEVWWLVQKPLSEDTVIANVLKWGTGALNIDNCRIASEDSNPSIARRTGKPPVDEVPCGWKDRRNAKTFAEVRPGESLGRFPSHLLLSHSEDCKLISGGSRGGSRGGSATAGFQDEYVGGKVRKGVQRMEYESEDLEKWECATDCAVLALDEQSAVASRFFYCAKISPGERNSGLDGFDKKIVNEACPPGSKGAKSPRAGAGAGRGAPQANTHPTVKPGKLMAYLIRLITPPGGVVLDPFMGSGSTGRAAIADGFEFVGIEREAEYFKIAQARIEHARKSRPSPQPPSPS